MIFPFLGLATSFIAMTQFSDYQRCVTKETVTDKNYKDRIQFALRNYSCWYFAFTLCKSSLISQYDIVYFVILYKPFKYLYKLSGVLMTLLVLAGYGVCVSGIIYTSKSNCKSTMLGKTSIANMVIFLVIASLMMVFSHTIIWLPLCRKGGEASTGQIFPKDEPENKPLQQ